jgi:hypothetical protein
MKAEAVISAVQFSRLWVANLVSQSWSLLVGLDRYLSTDQSSIVNLIRDCGLFSLRTD